MLFLLSPAKTLDFESEYLSLETTQSVFLNQSAELITELKKLSQDEIASLMSLSDKLAELNHQRFKKWTKPHRQNSSCRPAVLAFKGDVYQGLNATSWDKEDFEHAQRHLRILSGLYGLLRPLDLMKAYRLEMGTKFPSKKGKNLYEFWGSQITEALNKDLGSEDCVVNLASHEYFSAVKESKLGAKVVTPVFKDYKNGKFKIISFYAKKARGSMAAWAIKNRISKHEELIGFSEDAYFYDEGSSDASKIVFHRRLEP